MVANIKSVWDETDEEGNLVFKDGETGSIVLAIKNDASVVADELEIHVSPSGSDSGQGTKLSPVKTITKAFTLVTATRYVIRIHPGVYEEAAALAWPTIRGVAVIGDGNDVVSIAVPHTAATEVIKVTPGVQTSTFTGLLKGVEIVHEGESSLEAQSGIKFDNTGITRNIVFSINDCTFSPDAITDKSIDIATHDDADHAVRIYVSGSGNQDEIGGAIYFNVNNLADRLHFENCWLIGTITTPNVAKEFRLRLFKCIVPHEAATAGGNATQKITAVACHSWIDYDDTVAEIFDNLDTDDLTGSHTEVIVS
jgi:hypothetical protein